MRSWGTWIKHQVDFVKNRRIFFTGSATPLIEADQESGVGRWYTIRLTTLSFYEYLQLKKIKLPQLPTLKSLRDLFEWPQQAFYSAQELAVHYVGHFHEYLLRGGFPQTTQVESITQAQRLLREDIIDKVLKRDMTALFGVRRILELEQTFLYLCMNDGGLLELCQKKNITHGYVVTKSLDDFTIMKNIPDIKTKIMHIPAPLLCYWMGESELKQTYGF